MWGLYFCVLLIIEKSFLLRLLEKIPKVFSHIYLIFTVLLGWLLFISCDLSDPIGYFTSMFTAPAFTGISLYDFVRSAVLLLILSVAATPIPKLVYNKIEENRIVRIVWCIILPVVLLVCTAYLVDSSYNPFLYFRF